MFLCYNVPFETAWIISATNEFNILLIESDGLFLLQSAFKRYLENVYTDGGGALSSFKISPRLGDQLNTGSLAQKENMSAPK